MEKKEKSVVARELMRAGWVFRWVKLYHQGKVSLGKAAENLDMSTGELIDFLAELGVESPLEYDDYMAGFESLNTDIS